MRGCILKEHMLKRVAISFFFDEHGVVDEYMFYLLSSLDKFVDRTIFVANCLLDEPTKERLRALNLEIIERENVGFDVWAYKTGIEHIGFDNLADYDELLLYNHTFYGPIFPFSEMFSEMEKRNCDFWGITAHKEMIPNPFTNTGVLPRHINSHFIAVRGPLLTSDSFRTYWQDMPAIDSYEDSVLKHESMFTQKFISKGYSCEVYDDDDFYPSKYPCFINVDQALERRCPILKRRIFFHDPIFLEQNAIDLPRALRIMRATSSYDEGMIWKNVLRSSQLRTLNTNAALTAIVSDRNTQKLSEGASKFRVAVCAHIYYVDMLNEILDYADHIKTAFDIIITTDSVQKRVDIINQLRDRNMRNKVFVEVVVQNRGRDMSSLFITCRHFFIDDRYDLVCRLHTKKSPQIEAGRGNLFKRHMLENLVGSDGVVTDILEMFYTKPWLGLVVPPVVHISFPTLGNAWFANKPRAIEVSKLLELRVKLDADTPVAAYGTMFWFRPKALRKLFAHRWDWEDFSPEPHHVDGGLAHVLERLIGYTAQDAGYTTTQVLSEDQASLNYSMLEFKHQRLASFLPWNFDWQVQMLDLWKSSGYPIDSANHKARNERPRILSQMRRAGESYGKVVIQRLSAENRRALEAIIPGGQLGVDGDVKRPEIRFHRSLRVEQLRKRLGAKAPLDLFRRNIGAETLKYVEIVRDHVACLRGFLDQTRGRTQKGLEYHVRDREILDYLFFSWHEGREMTVLFDSEHYAVRNLEVKSAFNPFVHYLKIGARANFSPHPLFDSHFYLSQVTGRVVENPLVDYLTIGWREGLSPHPLFDVEYYLENNRDVRLHDTEPLSHYLIYGAKENRRPHWAFDSSFYLEKYQDIEVSGINPLIHFIQQGANEGRWPNRDFDPRSYSETYPETVRSGINPLVHYVLEIRSRLVNLQKLPSEVASSSP